MVPVLIQGPPAEPVSRQVEKWTISGFSVLDGGSTSAFLAEPVMKCTWNRKLPLAALTRSPERVKQSSWGNSWKPEDYAVHLHFRGTPGTAPLPGAAGAGWLLSPHQGTLSHPYH